MRTAATGPIARDMPMTEPRELALLSRAQQALAQAKTIDDLKTIRRQAESVRYAMRAHGYTLDAVNDAAELKVRAERRLGELLANGGTRPRGGRRKCDTLSHLPTLEDQGISRKQSERWQALAAIPENVFDEHITGMRRRVEQVTSATMGSLAKRTRAAATPITRWPRDERELQARLAGGETIVVNLARHTRLIEWARGRGLLVVIDRSSLWGNPFILEDDGDRATVIEKFARYYLPHKAKLRTLLSSLRGKALACHCAPEPCHGDVLRAEADKCA
jgi:hypothetical protein